MSGALGGLCVLLPGLLVATPAQAWNPLSLLHLADGASLTYEIVVTLKVDGVAVRGTAVHEILASTEIQTLPGTGNGVSNIMNGQAVVMGMPRGPDIYFLVVTTKQSNLDNKIMEDCGLQSTNPDPVERLANFRAFTGPCRLVGKDVPLAVRFDDATDETSGHEVRFPETGGPNGTLELVSVEVSRVDAQPTFDLKDHLPWWPGDDEHRGGTIVVQTGDKPIRLTHSDFMRR